VLKITVRRLLLIATFAICANITLPSATGQAPAVAYVISDNTSGYVLDQANANRKLQVASLTKIATAMVVLDWAAARSGDVNQLATVPASASTLASANGVGFQPGDRCSVRDLLYAALMQSDNIAAETLASHVGRNLAAQAGRSEVSIFVSQMNALARRLKMTNTRFLNPHGLDTLERALPYSTAADMAKLTAYAMANSAFRFHVSQKERKITILTANGEQSSYLLRNTNELLGIKNVDGVKTGTTRKAGECVIISAARAPESRQEGDAHIITPRRINVVVLGTTDRFNTAAQLLDRGWRLYDEWAAAGRPMRTSARR